MLLQTELNDKGKEPMFNSALEDLRTTCQLKRSAYMFLSQRMLNQAYASVRALQVQIFPRMEENHKMISMKYLQKNKNLFMMNNKKSSMHNTSEEFSEALWDWMQFLNNTAHELGLIMPDKPSVLGALEA